MELNLSGWIKLYRALLGSSTLRDGPELQVWIALLLLAEFGHGADEFPPGKVVISQRQLADLVGLTRDQVRRQLDKLEKKKRITRDRLTQHKIAISVCNWSTYQQSKTVIPPNVTQHLTQHLTQPESGANPGKIKVSAGSNGQNDPTFDPTFAPQEYNEIKEEEEKKCSSPHFDESSPEQRLAAKWCRVKHGPDATDKQIRREQAFAAPRIEQALADGLTEQAIAAAIDGSHDSIFDMLKAAKAWRPPEDWERSSNTPENPAYGPRQPASPETLAKFREMRKKLPWRATA